MNKRVILTISSGSFDTGFVTYLRIRRDSHPEQENQYEGELAAAPDIPHLFEQWQQAFSRKTNRESRIKSIATGSSLQNSCKHATEKLVASFNNWLDLSSSRSNIRASLYKNLHPEDEIRFIIQTTNDILLKLPWHLWHFFSDYPRAEIAIASNSYETLETPAINRRKPRILAILGDDSFQIDLQADRRFLTDLQQLNAETVFSVKPQRREFDRLIWDEQGWDILFFAGHSRTEDRVGLVSLNERENIAITDLKYALQRAIFLGLQIAIFNSCDGMGIANSLVKLNIPQIIIMRYPIPDRVAHEFLRNFLQAFTGGKSFYTSVREAREKLQGLENEIPCASWIPIIYQNPLAIPKTWRKLGGWYSLATENRLIARQRPDYRQLRELLLAGNWREADLLTRIIILKASDREHEGWLDERAINTLPSQDLRLLDHLWLKYSKGHFGFSVQKQVWSRVAQNTLAFGDCVGWRDNRTWFLYYSDFTFSLDAPQGHLPTWAKWCSGWRIWSEMWSQEFGTLGKLMEWVYLPGHYVSSLILSDAKWSNLLKEEEYKKESAIALFAKLDT